MTAFSIWNHIGVGTVERLSEKMLKALHPRASCTVIPLTLCHESVRQELIPENKRALWGSITETGKEWFVLQLAQSSAGEQQEWDHPVKGDKPGSKSILSPGSVLSYEAQSCRVRTQPHRIHTQQQGRVLATGSINSPGPSKAIG